MLGQILNSKSRIKILKASIIDEDDSLKKKYNVGDITEDFKVKCGRNFLKIEVIQKEGKSPMAVMDYLNGNKISTSSFS